MHVRISGGPGWATTQVYPAGVRPKWPVSVPLFSVLGHTDRHDADAAARLAPDADRPAEDLPADQFLDLGPDVARAYGCQEFAETDADGHVLVFGLCG